MDRKTRLNQAAYDALTPGGALISIEAFIDDARRTDALALLMSLNMLIEFGAGFSFTGKDFTERCTEAGFTDVDIIPLAGWAVPDATRKQTDETPWPTESLTQPSTRTQQNAKSRRRCRSVIRFRVYDGGLRRPWPGIDRSPGVRHHQSWRSSVTYSMACGDVMPGCDASFSADSKAALMEQIVSHAASAHGITEVTPEVATAVEAAIKVS